MLVLVAISPMNTRRAGLNTPCSRIQHRRAHATSSRYCSVARRRFLKQVLCRSKNRETALRLPEIRCLCSAATISSSDRSGCSSTSSTPLKVSCSPHAALAELSRPRASASCRSKCSVALRRDAPLQLLQSPAPASHQNTTLASPPLKNRITIWTCPGFVEG
jgi:hypothetical protein